MTATTRRNEPMDANHIITAVTAVTQKWTRQRKAEERRASSINRRQYAFCRSDRTTIKDLAWRGMEEAYLKASSGKRYPAHARQIMYAGRGPIQEVTGKPLDDQYYCQTLLPDYLNANPQ